MASLTVPRNDGQGKKFAEIFSSDTEPNIVFELETFLTAYLGSIFSNYANSVLALPLVQAICPFQKFSGMGLEAESSLQIIDCPCQLKGTASLRA